jgi:hypothetical protein
VSGVDLSLSINETVPIDSNGVSLFLKHLNEAKFWDLPSHEQTDKIGLDGAVWVIEGVESAEISCSNMLVT